MTKLPPYFLVGFALSLSQQVPIQTINNNPIVMYGYAILLAIFIIIGFLSLKLKFYESTFRLVIIGLWFGSFFFATIEVFEWILGGWEMLGSVFNIIFSIYFITLYQILEALNGKPVEDLVS